MLHMKDNFIYLGRYLSFMLSQREGIDVQSPKMLVRSSDEQFQCGETKLQKQFSNVLRLAIQCVVLDDR